MSIIRPTARRNFFSTHGSRRSAYRAGPGQSTPFRLEMHPYRFLERPSLLSVPVMYSFPPQCPQNATSQERLPSLLALVRVLTGGQLRLKVSPRLPVDQRRAVLDRLTVGAEDGNALVSDGPEHPLRSEETHRVRGLPPSTVVVPGPLLRPSLRCRDAAFVEVPDDGPELLRTPTQSAADPRS